MLSASHRPARVVRTEGNATDAGMLVEHALVLRVVLRAKGRCEQRAARRSTRWTRLLCKQRQVRAGGKRHHLVLLGELAHNVQRLRAYGASRADERDGLGASPAALRVSGRLGAARPRRRHHHCGSHGAWRGLAPAAPGCTAQVRGLQPRAAAAWECHGRHSGAAREREGASETMSYVVRPAAELHTRKHCRRAVVQSSLDLCTYASQKAETNRHSATAPHPINPHAYTC